MKEQPSNPCEKVSFILTYDQLEAAYNIYREQFISCDFIRRSMERLEERIGLCNLPYETLRDDPSLLHEAYLQFLRLEDCNVAYNDTLEQVIDAIEQGYSTKEIADHQKKKMRQLSGGMKRRVGLVQALLHEPDFLIVDEPTTGLDPEERIRIRNLLVDFAEERTVLFSTHVVEDLMATCNQLAVMKKGRFLYTGTMRELLNKARGHVWECCTEDESHIVLPDFLLYKRSHHHSRYLPLHIHLRSKSFTHILVGNRKVYRG